MQAQQIQDPINAWLQHFMYSQLVGIGFVFLVVIVFVALGSAMHFEGRRR